MANEKIYLNPSERETIITFNDESDEMHIYTAMRTVQTKLNKLVESHASEWALIRCDEQTGAREYKAPKNLLTFRAPREEKTLTEEERQAIRERLHK